MLKVFKNYLSSEVSYLVSFGLFRCISLSSTDYISVFNIGFWGNWIILVVPSGVIGLGRIFNMVGCCIDDYFQNYLSYSYSIYHFEEKVIFIDYLL